MASRSVRRTLITCHNLSKTYQTGAGAIPALAQVTLQIAPSEFVCLVGPSGCGKSTLLRLIAGFEQPSGGEIVFATPQPLGKQRTAMVFQEQGLFPWLTVLDNMAFGLEMQGIRRQERYAQAHHFIKQLGLTGFANHYPHQLSGGMRQRVGIARAWLAEADLLLMDEPFGALDAQTRLLLQETLLQIWKEQRKTVLYVTHDIEEAILLGDRILVMSGRPGRILEEITVPLARPRQLLWQIDVAEQQTITELRWHIWKKLEVAVR